MQINNATIENQSMTKNKVGYGLFQIDNIQFSEDGLGAYWTGNLLEDGTKKAIVGTFYDLDETGNKRRSREDQIAALLFDERVIDPAYRTTLIYDGACGFCRKTAQWVRGLDKKRLLRIKPLKLSDVSKNAWLKNYNDFWISNSLNLDGLRGIDAATEICELVLGPGNWIAQLMRVRPVKWLLWRVHYLVMNNRGWLIRFWNSDEVINESA